MGSAPCLAWAVRACFHVPKKRHRLSSVPARKLHFRLRNDMLAGYVVIMPAKGRGAAVEYWYGTSKLPFPVESGLEQIQFPSRRRWHATLISMLSLIACFSGHNF
jgi:hypothetical protein